MSTYELTVTDATVNYTALPVNYPQLSGGNTYQPAAYTEVSEGLISYAILLPIDAQEKVETPDTVNYEESTNMITCMLTVKPDTNTPDERLAMIKFSLIPQGGAPTASTTILVKEEESSENGYTDKKLGKVVMDSNILPTLPH